MLTPIDIALMSISISAALVGAVFVGVTGFVYGFLLLRRCVLGK